jgi:acid phosphatase type 7
VKQLDWLVRGWRRWVVGIFLGGLFSTSLPAHVGHHPSVHDTVAGIVRRLQREVEPDRLTRLSPFEALSMLTAAERRVLGTEHLSFHVNLPVRVSVVCDPDLIDQTFWLADQGYEPTDLTVEGAGRAFEVWRKRFEAGRVGLGVNSLSGTGEHYFVALQPEGPADSLRITDIYPGQHTLGTLERGERPYVDRPVTLDYVPDELEGQVLIRTLRAKRRDGRITQFFRLTDHPASERPDHIVLTWSEDPRTTQTIQWRTGVDVERGEVVYLRKSRFVHFFPGEPTRVEAEKIVLDTPGTANDPVVHRFTAVLRGLEPDTTYVYSVGDGTERGWSELGEFTTAPEGVQPFSFVYMGDAQNGLDRWGSLLHQAHRRRPDAAFYVMAGDLVDRGNDRDDWDRFFHNATGVYDRRQLVPALGNHEYQGDEPTLYLRQFTLPTNGPPEAGPERAYAFQYSNALFLILDSNQPPETQSAWIEERLAESDATWKFVVYHHPAYSSAPGRDNLALRHAWTPIFERHRVDIALQGHDHAYLRTYPMRGGEPVEDPGEGTIYIVSVSGTKMYAQADREYTAFGMTNVSTYQVLDIQISGDRLVYRAYDIDGELRDEIVIEK